MEFVLTHHHSLTPFNMLLQLCCNYVVTTQKSLVGIKINSFLCSERKRKQMNQPCCNKSVSADSNRGDDVTPLTSAWRKCKMINGAEDKPELSFKEDKIPSLNLHCNILC